MIKYTRYTDKDIAFRPVICLPTSIVIQDEECTWTCESRYGEHDYSSDSGVCERCGDQCEHLEWDNGYCKNCGYECSHSWNNGVCEICNEIDENYNDGNGDYGGYDGNGDYGDYGGYGG